MRQAIRTAFFSLVAALVALLAIPARAQDNVGPLVYTVGTTWHETATGSDWAYLLWLGSDSSLLNSRTFAIYAKSGDTYSTSPYQRVGVTALQADTHVITPLLQRATSIGEDLTKLDIDINALFGKIMPAGLSRAEKISAVLRGAVNDPSHYGKVMLLARTHPSVAMSMGVALAEPIGAGLTTFEVREFNNTTRQDVAVIGRVTVQAGVPTVLPAPGPTVKVPRNAARGDLNTALRWATPAGLLRLSLLQHGFNVYRVRKDYAENPSRNWHVTPPSGAAINAALSSTSAVRRVNTLPLITTKTFDAATVGNFTPPTGDSNTVFVTDADDRGLPGYVPADFTNGAHFYYFIAARDILGRDGLLSPGLEVLICDQLPPNALDKVEVANDYAYSGGVQKHSLRINWQQANNSTNVEEQIVSYWIYRWTNISQIFSNQSNPMLNLVDVVAHIPSQGKNSYLDDGPTAPTEATAINRTYYYTVRCMDNGACGGNLSPHSAPVAGALRDRVGPAGPSGVIHTRCIEPFVTQSFGGVSQNISPPRRFTIDVKSARTSSFITWVEVWAEIFPTGGGAVAAYTNDIYYFPPGVDANDWVFTISTALNQYWLGVHARCGSADGKVSSWSTFSQTLTVLDEKTGVDGFTINDVDSMRLVDPQRSNCPRHHPSVPGDNSIIPIDIDVVPTPTTREMRLYRRIDDGPLQLICQKTNPPAVLTMFTCQDDAFPPNASEICYFAQLFDEHGNPSPMVRLGCTNVASPIELPKPMLAPLVPAGDDTSPLTLTRWFCPPAGVERFEVAIAASPSLSTNPAAGLLIPTGAVETHSIPSTLPPSKKMKLVLSPTKQFTIYRTPRIGNGSSFGDGAQFSLSFDSVAGGDYVVFVRAVGKDGSVGPRSNFGRLKWATPTNTPLPTVDWPARPLPIIGSSFKTNFAAQWLQTVTANFTGTVVNIGYAFDTNNFACGDYHSRPQLLNNISQPMDYMFKDTNDLSLFPMVMYRYQVPNAKFPNVSGDIVQVSPMMENIAFERTNTVGSVIQDPFVVFDGACVNVGNGTISQLAIYFKDTQPVVAGSRYKYLLVRFQRDGEIAEVIPTNEVEVP